MHSAVAILVLRLHLRNAVRQNLNHGDKHCLAGVREYARHASLAADQSNSHVLLPHTTRAAIGAGPKFLKALGRWYSRRQPKTGAATRTVLRSLEWSWNVCSSPRLHPRLIPLILPSHFSLRFSLLQLARHWPLRARVLSR